jgi:hypothetical protein
VSIMLTHLRQSPNLGQHGSSGSAAVAAPQL